MWPFKQKPKGPQYSEEERRFRGFVPWEPIDCTDDAAMIAGAIIAKLMIRAHVEMPMGGK